MLELERHLGSSQSSPDYRIYSWLVVTKQATQALLTGAMAFYNSAPGVGVSSDAGYMEWVTQQHRHGGMVTPWQ